MAAIPALRGRSPLLRATQAQAIAENRVIIDHQHTHRADIRVARDRCGGCNRSQKNKRGQSRFHEPSFPEGTAKSRRRNYRSFVLARYINQIVTITASSSGMNQNRNMPQGVLAIEKSLCGFYPCIGGTASAQDQSRRVIHMSEKTYQILFGDPSSENLMLLESALFSCRCFALAQRLTDISAVVSYLARAGNFLDTAEYPKPDLVLLDLNLSGRGSGLEVLKWIHAQPLRNYRIVILSAAADDFQCEQAYALGADGFVSKPRSVAEMVEVLTRIEGWLRNSIVDDDPLEFCVA